MICKIWKISVLVINTPKDTSFSASSSSLSPALLLTNISNVAVLKSTGK
jgi:hypothetical protein